MLPWVSHSCLSACLPICPSGVETLITPLHSCSGMEEYDATYDSDEDADYSKMDMVRAIFCLHYLCSLYPLLYNLASCMYPLRATRRVQ